MIGVLRRIRLAIEPRALKIGLATIFAGVVLSQSAAAEDRYAGYVIDVTNGAVLYSKYADDRRYPASLTKIMTLYLVFEDLEAGKISTGTRLKVSQNAANQAPSKLGLKPGETITVDQAIRALVTKSANDVAVVVAENLGGSVSSFAGRMTRTAHAIGMSRTQFRNPHGLPDNSQYTTAHDMATLAIQTMRRFPKYYSYYSTRSFTWKSATYNNHNKLLGRVSGVDGMKTGYIRASGFNLVASMRRDGRHIVGVVMGGRTGASRDTHMRELLEGNIKRASTGTSMMFANAPLPRSRPDQASLPVVASQAQSVPAPRMVVPSTTVPGTLVTAGMVGKPTPLDTEALDAKIASVETKMAEAEIEETASIEPVEQGDVSSVDDERADLAAGEWIIQVGAFYDQDLAEAMLDRVVTAAPSLLSAARPYTESLDKNGKTLWRSRFAGFDQASAEGACAQLKRQSLGCYSARN